MSNLWINWRFAYWHLQIGRDWPWVAVRFNPYWWEKGIKGRFFDFT